MTTNEISYWDLQEVKRANRAKEEETKRSNLAREGETRRSNLANEAISRTSNEIKFAEIPTKYISAIAKFF